MVSERDILVSIAALSGLKGYPPTVRELAASVGLKSAGSIQTRLDSMRERGLVAFDTYSPRTLRLTERGYMRCLPTR